MENCLDCIHKIDKSFYDENDKYTLKYECSIGNNEVCNHCVESCKHLKRDEANKYILECYVAPPHIQHLDSMTKKIDEILDMFKSV